MRLLRWMEEGHHELPYLMEVAWWYASWNTTHRQRPSLVDLPQIPSCPKAKAWHLNLAVFAHRTLALRLRPPLFPLPHCSLDLAADSTAPPNRTRA